MIRTQSQTIILTLVTAAAAGTIVYLMKRARVRAQEQEREACLDSALADSFPASDPLPFSASQPQPPY
jgi:hypothetical protein